MPPELATIKRLADEAGLSFRLAKSGCFQTNLDYFMELQISKIKVVPNNAEQMTSEKLRDHDAVSSAQVDESDLKRVQALFALAAERAALEAVISQYRSAKFSKGADCENPG